MFLAATLVFFFFFKQFLTPEEQAETSQSSACHNQFSVKRQTLQGLFFSVKARTPLIFIMYPTQEDEVADAHTLPLPHSTHTLHTWAERQLHSNKIYKVKGGGVGGALILNSPPPFGRQCLFFLSARAPASLTSPSPAHGLAMINESIICVQCVCACAWKGSWWGCYYLLRPGGVMLPY